MSSSFVDDQFQFAEMNLRHKGDMNATRTLLRRAVRMNYDAIVINTDIGHLIFEDTHRDDEPPRKKKKKGGKQRNIIPDPVTIDVTDIDTSTLEANGKRLRLFNRLTATLSDSTEMHTLMHHPQLKKYDLIAVRIADEQILQTLSRKGEFVDIITYEQTSTSVNWLNKSKIIQQCIADGLTFEITYSNLLKDRNQRREALTNARQLLMSTKGGLGVILSSDAESMIDIRAPYDAANIAILLGIRPEDARKFIAGNAKRTLLRAESRKTIKGGMLVGTVKEMPKNLVKRLNTIEKIMRVPEFRAQLEIVKNEKKHTLDRNQENC